MKRTVLTSVGLSLLVVGCGGRPDEVTARLEPLGSCRDVEQSIRQAAIGQMNRRLDQAKQDYLNNPYGRCYGFDEAMAGAADGVPSSAPAAPTANTSRSSEPKQTSGTNNQVAGVDEADFVKNDGKHVYLVSGSSFRILQAWPPERTTEMAKVEIEGTGRKLFVHGDRALVYSSVPHTQPNAESGAAGDSVGRSSSFGNSECSYGYNCQFTGDGLATKVTVFDISDRTAPRVVRELRLSGSLIAARRVERAVHSVVSFPGVRFEGLSYWPEGLDRCGGVSFGGQFDDRSQGSGLLASWMQSSAADAFERLRRDNIAKIRATKLEDWLPTVTDTLHVDGEAKTQKSLLADCGGFYRSSLNDGDQFTSVISLDILRREAPRAATIVSRPGAVYASAGALYLSVPRERADSYGWYRGFGDAEQTSTVHKFALSSDPPTVAYAASGVVKGRVLNQFSMDEREGFLRIATTSGRVPSPDVHSTLTVLSQAGDDLERVGMVDNLAPKEDIRSVRFADDRGYIVTFKKTDPLFVLDLANPRAPRVLAELKIPGFSTYMHMMDDKHLLTIGYDADDQGSFAWFQGVLLQIFDVENPSAPRLVQRHVIGTRGSSSEALTNHLAFTYFAPKKVLALPMTVCEGGSGGGGYGTTMTFSGLMVFDVSAERGFDLRGRVPHAHDAELANASCRTWWTNATSQVKRSIFMDDYVFSISQSLVKVNNLANLAQDVASISLD